MNTRTVRGKRIGEGVWLIESRSHPGEFYEVDLENMRCWNLARNEECPNRQHNPSCPHLVKVSDLELRRLANDPTA